MVSFKVKVMSVYCSLNIFIPIWAYWTIKS